ncbi:MAG: rhomboid family intramembrane serine protease [Nitrososphaeraceae archaeon]
MFPIHDDTQRLHGRPYVNYGLIFVNVVVFIWELSFTSNFTDPIATQELFYTYGSIPRFVLSGDVVSIITSMFMHGGIAHIAGNMVFLFVFGDNIEDKFGHLKFLLIYLLWGILAAYAHSLVATDNTNALIPAVGASGAISGVLGAYLVMFPRAKIFTVVFAFFITTIRIPAIAFLPIWFIMQLVFGFIFPQSGGVAYFAHIGGFVAGLGTAYVWKLLVSNRDHQPRDIRSSPIKKIAFNRPENQLIRGEPEIIKGPNFYEILAEAKGISGLSDVSVNFEPHNSLVRITDNKSKISQILAKLPEDATKYNLQETDYLNGIIRVRLS